MPKQIGILRAQIEGKPMTAQEIMNRLNAAKSEQLAEDWGYDDIMSLIEDYVMDSVCPAICMNPGCDYSTEMEPDQSRGWCECCGENTVQSAMVIEGVI